MPNLHDLKEKIESLTKHHQIEVLHILSKITGVCLNENNNGTFVNLTEQSDDVITKLMEYIKYVDVQQSHLQDIEEEKDRIENEFFTPLKN